MFIKNSNNSHNIPLLWGCEIAPLFESYYDKISSENSKEIKLLKDTIINLKNEKKIELENASKANILQAEELKRLSIITKKIETELVVFKTYLIKIDNYTLL